MDKNAIKKYAIWARRELIDRVTKRAAVFGITPNGTGDFYADSINGHLLSSVEKRQRQALIHRIEEKGYEQVIEEVAYTWFNRFAALRFMEVNGYLPSHIRVFTDDDGRFRPQILAEAIHLELDGLNMEKVYQMKDANKEEELFKYLLIVQCNALNSILPGMFQRIEDYTELLLPDYLLREGSVIQRMISDIPESDFDVNSEEGQIEIIGWLYQYYISEKHEEVVDPLHGKIVKKEEVPAATQLFTTDWVVRYLIDNSVGRYWIERNPNSKLADKLTYFVKPKNVTNESVNERITPQEITTFDPCVGSGHFLIYAFEVLMHIYLEYGYSEREAAAEIVKNNLFGLDIDGRAVQLAYFAVMMKARQYDRRFFTRNIQPCIYEIMESNYIDKASVEYFCGDDKTLEKDILSILNTLTDAKEYGSILQMPTVDYNRINNRFEQLDNEITIYNTVIFAELQPLIRAAELMGKHYAIVATNPPYFNKYDSKLKEYISLHYNDYSGDLFSVFMFRNFQFCIPNGYSGFMAPFVWMFIKSYEPLRQLIIREKALTTLIQMEYSAFEEATVPICSFVFKNGKDSSCALCFKLSDFKGGMDVQKAKTLEAINNPNCGYFYEANINDFTRIPGTPISFWASESLYRDFENIKIQDIEPPRFGMSTSDNNRFVRIWHEVAYEKFAHPSQQFQDVDISKKWYPYNNGGEFRRWYGDNGDVVNWEKNGEEIKDFGRAAIRNKDFYYKAGITWTAISSAKISVRAFDYGFLFSSAGFCIFEENLKLYLLSFMNSNVCAEILRILSPTINFNVGDIARLPVIISTNERETIERIASENIAISRVDWDSFETSWDFQMHPLVSLAVENKFSRLEDCWCRWEQICEDRFAQLKANEEELNRIFINIYHLQDELSPDVDDRDITVRRADLGRDIRSLISYAVGCMLGRYSLDKPGLAFAGGIWDASQYITYKADKDGILPITDDEYFYDDIVTMFVDWVKTVYSVTTLEDNLKFIANALDGKGSPRDVIRNYFLNNFYQDHIKIYQKRPIYWLFDSGKKNGFKALIYMHRYRPDTIARIRTDYVHEMQSRYRTAIEDAEQRLNSTSTSERIKVNKHLMVLQSQAEELQKYEENIHHLADQMIELDLDKGVKHNYEVLKNVLRKIN